MRVWPWFLVFHSACFSHQPSCHRTEHQRSPGDYTSDTIGRMLVEILACLLIGTWQLSEPMLTYCWLDSWKRPSVTCPSNHNNFIKENEFKFIVCKTVAVVCQSQCLGKSYSHWFCNHARVSMHNQYVLGIPKSTYIHRRGCNLYIIYTTLRLSSCLVLDWNFIFHFVARSWVPCMGWLLSFYSLICIRHVIVITVTSQRVRWRLKLPASLMFAEPFVQAQVKDTLKFSVNGLCEGKSPMTEITDFPAQRASDAENVFIWWCHHGLIMWDYLIKGRVMRRCECIMKFGSWYGICNARGYARGIANRWWY